MGLILYGGTGPRVQATRRYYLFVQINKKIRGLSRVAA